MPKHGIVRPGQFPASNLKNYIETSGMSVVIKKMISVDTQDVNTLNDILPNAMHRGQKYVLMEYFPIESNLCKIIIFLASNFSWKPTVELVYAKLIIP